MKNKSPYKLDKCIPKEDLVASKKVFFDGVLKGDYSLAIVNRQVLRSLRRVLPSLTAFTPEDGWRSDALLNEMPDVAGLCIERYPEKGSYDVHLRNTWPPKCDDMVGRFNAYVCFAWEESELPRDLVEHFNAHLDLVMVTSNFVEESFRRSGLRIPIAVVGNGTDHVLANSLVSTPSRPERRRILHISSCFPRKGVDSLVEAYAQEFKSEDAVELYIKTFDNPHNDIDAIVARQKRHTPLCAEISIVKASISNAALVDLLRSASVLAAPSRGEGFGLPLAEAIQLGVPVVTTAYGGQTDFCGDDTAWLVAYDLEPSGAHVSGRNSLWAEPSVASLRKALRAAIADRVGSEKKVRAGQAVLNRWFKWSDVARRICQAVTENLPKDNKIAHTSQSSFKIDLVTTWKQVCGIATYSAHLFSTPALKGTIEQVYARALRIDLVKTEYDPTIKITRPWGYDSIGVNRLAEELQHSHTEVLWFQHHPGFFSDEDMGVLAEAFTRSRHKVRIITLHNVLETVSGPAAWLSLFDSIIVHTEHDAQLLAGRGLGEISVIPHGVLAGNAGSSQIYEETFSVGTFGFLYPHKNIPLLIDAFSRAYKIEPRLRLKLFTCVRRDRVSYREQLLVEAMIERTQLGAVVDANFEFLDDDAIVAGLSKCSLICFPYGDSSESATGAARIALRADRPLLCSTSRVLRDIAGYSLLVPKLEVAPLAEALLILSASPQILALRDTERRKFVQRTSFDSMAQRHRSLIERHVKLRNCL